MPKVTVDGEEIEVPAGATVMQAAELAGKEIPRFCYHERLSIAGNCRMCLVEVKPGPPKPQASCALPTADGQEIITNSEMVKKAREGVMEFLLINHPLDCPICDQGGECDLQDQSIAYGKGASRYDEHKRAVTEKYMGPIVNTIMTRCIHCTRCVRFAEEVAGVEEIGAIYRGENMQITSYLEKAVTSELSGNVVDLCPVGALTSKPYKFEARPWELTKTLGIDVMDALGTNIRIDSAGREVLRILPRVNEDVNEEWAHDKTRYAMDGLLKRRLDRPYLRRDGKLQVVSWAEAFQAIADVNSEDSVAAIAGDLVDCETMFAAKRLVNALGSTMLEGRQTGLNYPVESLSAINYNTRIADTEYADIILLISTNPRWEAPLVNTRIQKAVRQNGAKVFAIGPKVDLGYAVEWLGDDMALIKSPPQQLADALQMAKRPIIIVGPGALAVEGALGASLHLAEKYNFRREVDMGNGKQSWNGFNVLHISASRMGGLILGYAQRGGIADIIAAKPKLLFALGADEMGYGDFTESCKVYIGHHGDKGAHNADVILPAAAYTEKNGTFVNLEGRVQFASKALFAPGDAREDWSILRALSDILHVTLDFDNFDDLRAAMVREYPELGDEGLIDLDWSIPDGLAANPQGKGRLPIKDFYLTNAIARASVTMRQCSDELLHGGGAKLEAAE